MIASNLQVHKDALALMKLIIHYLNCSTNGRRLFLETMEDTDGMQMIGLLFTKTKNGYCRCCQRRGNF